MSYDSLVLPDSITAEDMLDRIGRLVDSAENFLMYTEPPLNTLGATTLDALRHGLTDLRDGIKSVYLDLGGEDVWETFDTLPPADYAGGN